jgi:predicted HD phosphohydrolase
LWQEKVALRRWDDEAKVVNLDVPGLDSYRHMAREVLAGGR